jgi:hypothetical protein
MIFEVELDVKKQFICPECNKMRDILIWKSIGSHININGDGYLCEECWSNIDKSFEMEIMNKLDDIDFISEDIKRKLKLRKI